MSWCPYCDDPFAHLIDEAKTSYVDGHCTLTEFETVLDHILTVDYPIPLKLGIRTIPSQMSPFTMPRLEEIP